jgi:hypothetical protein
VAFISATNLLPIHLPVSRSRIPIGRLVAVSAYSCVIAVLLVTVDAPKLSGHFLDDIAFRAAWVTATQVPLVCLLSTKRGPINFLTGISHERINWLHRWTGRMLFLCATIHMVIIMSSISIRELLKSHDEALVVVRYGMGAYAMLTWIATSSVLPLRRWSYRAFHLNHCVCTLLFLGLVANHVPSYARLSIHVSFALIATDKCLCAFRFLSNNISIQPLKNRDSSSRNESRQVLGMGHPVKMMTPSIMNSGVTPKESTTVIRISDIPFSWKPGQHIRLYIPRLGAVELHSFTPATCSDVSASLFPHAKDDAEHYSLISHNSTPTTNDMVLMIKARSGFTMRLSEYHSHWLTLPCPNATRPSSSLTAYVDGPFGNPPAWELYENVVLLATSTGVTFLLSILDYLGQLCFHAPHRLRTQRIKFVWANRHIEPQFEAIVTNMLSKHKTILRETNILVDAEFYITCNDAEEYDRSTEMRQHDPFAYLRRPRPNYFARRPLLRIRNPNALNAEEENWYEEEEGEAHSLKQMRLCVGSLGNRSSSETYVSSTLVGNDSDDDDVDSMLDELDSSCWSRMSLLRRSPTRQEHKVTKACSCTEVQYEQRKSRLKPLPAYISRVYGQRPQIASILSTSVSRTSTARTMVAVCSNANVLTEARATVSKLSMNFARGRREGMTTLYTEGYD